MTCLRQLSESRCLSTPHTCVLDVAVLINATQASPHSHPWASSVAGGQRKGAEAVCILPAEFGAGGPRGASVRHGGLSPAAEGYRTGNDLRSVLAKPASSSLCNTARGSLVIPRGPCSSRMSAA